MWLHRLKTCFWLWVSKLLRGNPLTYFISPQVQCRPLYPLLVVHKSLASGTVPAGDPREPVLYIRCTDGAGLGPLERDAVGDSWSPKIAAVLTKSLEGVLLDH